MAHEVKAMLRRFTVYFALVFMAQQNIFRGRHIREALQPVYDLAAVFVMVVAADKKTEYPHIFAFQNFRRKHAVLKNFKMVAEIVGYFDFADGRAYRRNAYFMRVKHFLRVKHFFPIKQAYIFAVYSADLNVFDAVGLQSFKLLPKIVFLFLYFLNYSNFPVA
jgi:hypothetical protein